MQRESFVKALMWVRGACAIQNTPVEGSIEIQYAELNNLFTDEEIMVAARKIAMNEDLYGNFPSLKVWLKYSVAKNADAIKRGEFLELICGNIDDDALYYSQKWYSDRIKKDFGWRGYNAIKNLGLSLLRIREQGRVSAYERQKVLDMLSQSWDNSDNRPTQAVLSQEKTKLLQGEQK